MSIMTPDKPSKIKIEIVERHQLQETGHIKTVEFDQTAAAGLLTFFAKNVRNATNNLAVLLSPPGQSGDVRFVDTVIEVTPEMADGSYFLIIDDIRKHNLDLENHVVQGFASIFPDEARLRDAFDQGYSFWATLGNTLVHDPSGFRDVDFGHATIWAPDGKAVSPINSVLLPNSQR